MPALGLGSRRSHDIDLYVSMPMMAVVELVATGSVTAQCSGAVGALIPNELLIAELSAMQVESIH